MSLRRELQNNLTIGLATGVIGGGLLGFLAAAATLALNPALLRSVGDVLRLLLGLQLVYALLCLTLGLAGVLGKTLFYLLTGRSVSDTKTAALFSGIAIFLATAFYGVSWSRWQGIGGLTATSSLTLSKIPILLAIAVVSAVFAGLTSYAFYLLIIHVKKPERRQPGDLRRAFRILLYMGGAFVLFVAVMRLTAAPPAEPSALTRESIHPDGRRVLLLGIDGIDREDIQRLRRQGLLPWAGPLLTGALADIPPLRDPVPPMVWTVMATGRDLAAHAGVDFQAQVIRGLSTPLSLGPNQVGLYELFHTVLPFLPVTRPVPMRSYMRESKGLWNMASDAGRRGVAVNWWVSWPAERVRGDVVSDHAWLKLAGPMPSGEGSPTGLPAEASQTFARAAATVQTEGEGGGAMTPLRPDGLPLVLERETYPSTLLLELWHLAATPMPESLAARFGPPPTPEALAVFERLGIPADVLRSDLFYAQAAALLRDQQKPDLWMLHLPGPDILRRVLQRKFARLEAREAARQEALSAYWRTLDPAVSACLRDPGEGRTGAAEPGSSPLVLWIALPGHTWPETADRPGPGLFALAGSGVQRARLPLPVQLAEIAPTVLWLLGLPAAQEMDGRPRTDVLTEEGAASLLPVHFIRTYGRQETEGLEQAPGTLDQEMLERFKSLGYIR